MATLVATGISQGLYMDFIPFFVGDASASSSQITTYNNTQQQNYFGQFQYDAFGNVHGTLESVTYSGPAFQYSVTGLSFNANTAYLLISAGQIAQLSAQIFEGNDTMTGSGMADRLFGYGGNDHFYAGIGNDYIDGGTGTDTVHIASLKNAMEVSKSGDTFSFTGINDGEVDTISNVERVLFDDGALAFDIDGNAGKAYRLYKAAFDREPDTAGLGWWIKHLDAGMSLTEVSRNFQDSDEFKSLYGSNISDSEFITLLYQNVLNRAPEQAGFDHWMNMMSQGTLSSQEVLVSFSESAENQAQVIGAIEMGMEYTYFS